MYEQPLHMQRNSSTSGFNATRDPKDIHPGTRLTQYYQSWWLSHEITLTAQRNTVGHKKRFSNETTYISSPKDWRSLTISQPHGGWFSQECRPEIKFLYQRVEAHSATNKPGCPYPHKDETPWYLHYVRIPQCEQCWATTGSTKTEENGYPRCN
jgi:hypothetical protein